MACTGSYAHPFDYGVIFMCETIESGIVTAGAASSDLVDAAKDFGVLGVEVGAPVYNPTTGIYGYVTVVAGDTITTSTALWTLGDAYQIVYMNAEQVATVQTYLRIGAGDITVALMAVGAQNCSISCADAFVRNLNVVLAAVKHACPCERPNLTENARMQFLQWSTEVLRNIWTGELELCDGETGSNFPAVGIAQQAWTAWRAAEIVLDSLLDDTV